jgi:hypothetical protein
MTIKIIGKRECEWCDDSSERNTDQRYSFSQGSSEIFHSLPLDGTKMADKAGEVRCVCTLVEAILQDDVKMCGWPTDDF